MLVNSKYTSSREFFFTNLSNTLSILYNNSMYVIIVTCISWFLILCCFYIAECTFIILDKHVYLRSGNEIGVYFCRNIYLSYSIIVGSLDDMMENLNHHFQIILDGMVGDTNLFLHNLQGFCIAEIEIMIAEEDSRSRRRGWESVILMLLYGNITML